MLYVFLILMSLFASWEVCEITSFKKEIFSFWNDCQYIVHLCFKSKSNKSYQFKSRYNYLFEWGGLDESHNVCEDARRLVDIWQMLYDQVGGKGIRQTHGAWERWQNQVAHLDTVGWNYITESVVIITEEFWEIMK